MTPFEGAPIVELFSRADVLAQQREQPDVAAMDAPAPAHAALNPFFTETEDASGKFDAFLSSFNECHQRMRAAGFSTLTYGAFEMVGQRMLYAHILRDLAPVSFIQPYFSNMWYEVDPRFAEMQQTGFPVAWGLGRIEEQARASNDRRMQALSASLRAHNMRSGVIFALSAPQLGLRVSVGLSSETHDHDWINDRVFGTALAISLAVHRFVQPFLEARVRRIRTVVLAHEQEAVLERLVQGFSDQGIADALQISLHKVGYHIHWLERLFNAQNRAQLAYLAGRRLRAWAPGALANP